MYALETAHPELTAFEHNKAVLLGSFMIFLRTFYKIKNGREFIISQPHGRESHFNTIGRELKNVFMGDTTRLIINIPPGYGKSTLLSYWVAWCMANYPDSNFLYISYAYELAEKHTSVIKEIMELPHYRKIFDIHLRTDSKAKGKFKTVQGGTVAAFGSAGAIVGQDAGLPGLDRFSGAVIIDDPHKPDECHSDTIRQSVIDNYNETIKQRPRGPNVPIIFIGQRLHEADLADYLIREQDGFQWKKVILAALDGAGNALYPEFMSKDRILRELEYNPYTAWSQLMQQPQPAGGGIFKKDDFLVLPEEPEIIATFVTVDSAESQAKWADYTAMSFWGAYKIKFNGEDTGLIGLHWLDCRELKIEPKDLENEFFDFYTNCMRYKIKPRLACIEKKSTGVTLVSTLRSVPGLRVVAIERTAASLSKMDRFIQCQSYVASHQVTFTAGARHTDKCIEHMRKITANDTHAHDDVADTMQMAIQYALIDGSLLPKTEASGTDAFMASMAGKLNTINSLRSAR